MNVLHLHVQLSNSALTVYFLVLNMQEYTISLFGEIFYSEDSSFITISLFIFNFLHMCIN